MNKIRIPISFELGGRTITIKYKNNMVDEDDSIGYAKYRKNEIWIQENITGTTRTIDHTIETFLHELIHWILYMISENELRDNEKFVQLFSEYLHQALKTAEYK